MHQVASALAELGEHREALECCLEWEATVGAAMTPDWLGLLAQTKAESCTGLGMYERAVESCHQHGDAEKVRERLARLPEKW
ncbi:hypothetical protein ADL03_32095 [Nocardia sp. NRRL S-836]|nr:hypothetical protein ADL03_32095 [Nocardia sp. NRRL S-836]